MEETRVPGVNTVKWIEPMAIQIGTTMKNLRRSGCTQRPHTTTKMNYNLHMDSTIAWSMNVGSYLLS
jgi:hypothetical protein